MQAKQILLLSVCVVLLVFLVTAGWEFLLEDAIYQVGMANGAEESAYEHWEYVFTATLAATIAVTILGLASHRIMIQRDQSEVASQAKSAFLSNMSHELRTPLNAIIGFSDIIKNEKLGTLGNSKYRNYANDINVSGLHLLDLINDILDMSKIEAGESELQEEVIEICELVRRIMRLVTGDAEKSGVKLELDVPDDAPALRADDRKVKQILINLLSNAIKFTPEGGKVTLRTWSRADSGYVFQVTDTGIGIAPTDIPKALTPFQQIDSDLNRQYQGTGLGLPLTKALVEMHGGSLDLQSEVGVGTTVTVRFPAERIVHIQHESQILGTVDRQAS